MIFKSKVFQKNINLAPGEEAVFDSKGAYKVEFQIINPLDNPPDICEVFFYIDNDKSRLPLFSQKDQIKSENIEVPLSFQGYFKNEDQVSGSKCEIMIRYYFLETQEQES